MTSDSVQEIADRVGSLYSEEAKALVWDSRLVKIILIVGGGLAVGIAQFTETVHHWPKWVGVCGALAMAIGGFIGVLREKTSIQALEEARSALEAARSYEVEGVYVQNYISDIEDKLKRMSHLHTAQFTMRETVEQCLMLNQKNEAVATQMVLTSAAPLLRAALNFQMDEEWTLSVYQARPDMSGKETLFCVAADRFDKREANLTRSWPIGVGHTGSTFAKADETVVPDLSALQLGTLDKLPSSISHESDAQRYRSIAAVPINVLNDAAPWGVVVATSSKPNKFTLDHDQKGSLNAEVVRAFAGIMALSVATQR